MGPTALRTAYPWTSSPLIVSAPLRAIAGPQLAVAVSRAGGLGFIGAGYELESLHKDLQSAADLLSRSPVHARSNGVLPIGVGFINWGADLSIALPLIEQYTPAALWLFAPRKFSDLRPWVQKVREVTQNRTKIWIQIGSVADALQATQLSPDTLVVQGSDAGGHGLVQSASIVTLLPEVDDALRRQKVSNIELVAAGGIMDGRGTAAALSLGASGIVMGTRFLASNEANITEGYKNEVIRSSDGGLNTVRTKIYDNLRGSTGWPDTYNARGIINQSFVDAQGGMDEESNKKLYVEAMKLGDEGWGPRGRIATYAGTGIGLITEKRPAEEIVQEVRRASLKILNEVRAKL